VHDLVYREGGAGGVGVRFIIGGERFGDARQPFIQLFGGAGVECWEAADNAGHALRNDQIWIGDNEKRGADDREAEAGGYGSGESQELNPYKKGRKEESSFSEEKEAKRLLLLHTCSGGRPVPPPQICKSFLLLFFKKEVLFTLPYYARQRISAQPQ
jgi:hypothetical protein